MPYEKRHTPCTHKDGTKGTFKTKNKETGEWKCWESEAAFQRSQKARHAKESLTREDIKKMIREELQSYIEELN